ncbi:PREDICTED: cytochrome c1, heme protein, mitochondrial [Ceratosolen solmsi marchali]|uniref:Cytochrome c1, heme protein, mitochondrial n=2 Tax=Ceratosolen solmsi TaxID=142686 RepID=A0AAJ6YF45_9HYME|nr:PREDICTED: cytochrome c1, heme protein, mitochondrial [Ceratosolen solmsi marchali]AIX97503.1 mitochondrial cytochrome c1 [Ceratosolen solmsi]
MAASLGRICRLGLLKPSSGSFFNQASKFSTTKEWSRGRKVMATCVGVATGGIGTLLFTLDQSVKAVEIIAHPPSYPWSFSGIFSSLDHASIRRGWEVYKNVCSACHSLEYVAFRHLVNVTHTEEEAKALAEEVQVQDGPNDVGEYFMRPGKLFDTMPSPYPNEEAARAANNGAYPPDLTYIINARHGGQDYVFSLLTGYYEEPAGMNLREGQYYNPYFPGGAIGMAQPIYNEIIEYEDGTPATTSQLAKDVVTFLVWTANQEFDERKRLAIKVIGITAILLSTLYYIKRHKFNLIKNTKLVFVQKNKK